MKKESEMLRSLIREFSEALGELDKRAELIFDSYLRILKSESEGSISTPDFFEKNAKVFATIFQLDKNNKDTMAALKEIACLFGSGERLWLGINFTTFLFRAAAFKAITGESQPEIFKMTLRSMTEDTNGSRFVTAAKEAGLDYFLRDKKRHLFTFKEFPSDWTCD